MLTLDRHPIYRMPMSGTRKPETLEQAEARVLGLTVDELRASRAGTLSLTPAELLERYINASQLAVIKAGALYRSEPTALHELNLNECRAELNHLLCAKARQMPSLKRREHNNAASSKNYARARG